MNKDLITSRDQAPLDQTISASNPLNGLFRKVRQGELVIIASPPAFGKTALGLAITRFYGVDNNIPVAYFSLEMNKERLSQRMLAGLERVPLSTIHHPEKLSDQEKERICAGAAILANSPIYINDAMAISLDELHDEISQLKTSNEVEIAIIDYLQLLRVSGPTNKARNFANILSDLKSLARNMDLSIAALWQISKRNTDFPESFEEDKLLNAYADTLIFINKKSRKEGLAPDSGMKC